MKKALQLCSNLNIPHSFLFLVGIALLLSSCAHRQTMDLPSLPVDKTGMYHHDRFIWFELLTDDRDRVEDFYSNLFGWRFVPSPASGNYRTIMNGDTPIGGVIDLKDEAIEPSESRWISTFSVADVDQAADLIEQLGGEVIGEIINAHERGRLAQVKDAEGAEFVIQRSQRGDPPRYQLKAGNPVWIDLFSRDLKGASGFYDSLANFTLHPFDDAENHYYFAVEGKIRAGLVVLEYDDILPNWLPFVGVKNIRATIKAAIENGGRLMAYNDEAAVILDPSEAALGIHLLPAGAR